MLILVLGCYTARNHQLQRVHFLALERAVCTFSPVGCFYRHRRGNNPQYIPHFLCSFSKQNATRIYTQQFTNWTLCERGLTHAELRCNKCSSLLRKSKPSSCWKGGSISKHTSGLGTNKNMAMGPNGGEDQQQTTAATYIFRSWRWKQYEPVKLRKHRPQTRDVATHKEDSQEYVTNASRKLKLKSL
jgi:hypothetical protein